MPSPPPARVRPLPDPTPPCTPLARFSTVVMSSESSVSPEPSSPRQQVPVGQRSGAYASDFPVIPHPSRLHDVLAMLRVGKRQNKEVKAFLDRVSNYHTNCSTMLKKHGAMTARSVASLSSHTDTTLHVVFETFASEQSYLARSHNSFAIYVRHLKDLYREDIGNYDEKRRRIKAAAARSEEILLKLTQGEKGARRALVAAVARRREAFEAAEAKRIALESETYPEEIREELQIAQDDVEAASQKLLQVRASMGSPVLKAGSDVSTSAAACEYARAARELSILAHAAETARLAALRRTMNALIDGLDVLTEGGWLETCRNLKLAVEHPSTSGSEPVERCLRGMSTAQPVTAKGSGQALAKRVAPVSLYTTDTFIEEGLRRLSPQPEEEEPETLVPEDAAAMLKAVTVESPTGLSSETAPHSPAAA